MFNQIYTKKRVFITGHTGFKGSWLTTWLLQLGATVAGYSLNTPTTPSFFESLGLEKRITHFTGDVRDKQTLTQALQSFKPHIVFHLAAQALVRPSYADPSTTFETNAIGTLNLLEAVKLTPEVQAVICITSDKCYQNNEWVWGYKETDHLGGEDPYSASKACAEIIAHSYFRSFFAQGPVAATARAGNVIGGGDFALDRIVPDSAKAWQAGKPVTIRSPKATRPWQHVLEPLSGYLWLGSLLLQNQNTSSNTTPTNKTAALKEANTASLPHIPCIFDKQAYNFGPSTEIDATVQEVTESLATYWKGFSVEYDVTALQGKKEATLLKLCCDKALAHLAWQATLSFTETLRLTAHWYAHFYATQNDESQPFTPEQTASMWDYTLAQINEYTILATQKNLAWVKV